MSARPWTPGPWREIDDESGFVRIVGQSGGEVGEVWEPPDAHLAAAAPALYGALEELLRMQDLHGPACGCDTDPNPHCAACRAELALEQARGEVTP